MLELSNELISDWDEIVSIEYVGIEPTIDINVTNDRLFWANDILTHNSAGESIEFGQHHIAGGKSKIDTADNVIAIFTTAAMKEQGRYQLQFIKTRSSSGVGTFLDMIFNTKTLRVEDMPEGAPGSVAMQTTNVLDTLKRNNNMVSKTEEKDKSPLKGAMDLQSILRNIK